MSATDNSGEMNILVSAQSGKDVEIHPLSSNILQNIADALVADSTADFSGSNSISMPIAEISALGAGVSSLIPAFNTIRQTVSVSATGLYKLANTDVGDTLKVAKNGNFWGAFKTVEGESKLVQLQNAGPLTVTSNITAAANPATVLMAVTLYSIEQKLAVIQETGQEILSFLEAERESEIEADVETLMAIIKKYKYSWDNSYFVASNHKLVLDIQRTARKNLSSFNKKVAAVLNPKTQIISGKQVGITVKELFKNFRYYRLSLYTFSLASLLEIMLSGNFQEENISCVKEEIEQLSLQYRDEFSRCSAYLEKCSSSSIEINILKGTAAAENALGKFIGSIPVIRNGPVDELLQSSGSKREQESIALQSKAMAEFASIHNPETAVFIEKLQDMLQIYCKTEEIYLDGRQIYLVGA